MGLFGFLGRLGLKSILRSALTLEEEIYGLFESLERELKGLEVPADILSITEEERRHQRLIRRMIDEELPEEKIEEILSGKTIHRIEEVKPLPGDRYAPVLERLRQIKRREEEVLLFFRSLYQKSKLPFVKRAFRFLTEQEQVHVNLLDRLLG